MGKATALAFHLHQNAGGMMVYQKAIKNTAKKEYWEEERSHPNPI